MTLLNPGFIPSRQHKSSLSAEIPQRNSLELIGLSQLFSALFIVEKSRGGKRLPVRDIGEMLSLNAAPKPGVICDDFLTSNNPSR